MEGNKGNTAPNTGGPTPPPATSIVKVDMKLPVIMAIVAAVLVLLSVFMLPWYHLDDENTWDGETEEQTLDYTLDKIKFKSGDEEDEIEYDDTLVSDDLMDILDTTRILGIVTGVVILLGFVFALLLHLGNSTKLFAMLMVVMLILGAVMSIVTPLYFMVKWTDMMNEDVDEERGFFDSYEDDDGDKTSQRPGTSWFMFWVSAALCLVAFIFGRKGLIEASLM